MTDYIVRATAANAQIRAFASTTREMVEFARMKHNTSPVATAALGRLMTAGGMMGSMMKGEKDLLTLQMKGSGPIGAIVVTADANARVKGYVNNPNVLLPPNDKGKLDVGGAIGLGVLMEKDNTVKQAGGFIVQLMPFAEEKVISRLEENIKNISSVTSMLDEGLTPEQILERLLDGLDLEITDKLDTTFYCNCSKERVEKALISVGKKEIESMIADGKPIVMNCHFCNTDYTFETEELKQILKKAVK